MNREIKFRAWDKLKHKMMETSYFDMWYYTIAENDETGRSRACECKDQQDYCRANLEIMQFTGLKDTDGKEIYEGDILYTSDLYRKHFVVGYSGRSFELYDNKDGVVFDPNNDWSEYEVVGNIYENPELLEKKND